MREKDLSSCQSAKDILPTMCAIDAFLMQDKTKNAINSVTLEKLGRKAFGIVKAFESVQKESDWKKTGGKDWKSKVDFESWKRIDPSREGEEEHVFVNRVMEDDMRGEMDREAAIAKARTRLAEAKGNSQLLASF